MLLDAVVSPKLHTTSRVFATKGMQLTDNAAAGRAHRDYLRQVMAATGLKATPLARRVGVHPTTFTELLQEPDDSPRTLHAGTRGRWRAFSGRRPRGMGEPVRRPPRGFSEDAAPFELDGR